MKYLLCLALWAVVALEFQAAEPTKEQAAFFEKQVRPILVERCFACHSEVAKKHKGELLVDSRAALLAGGDSGPALVPGAPDKSRLIEAVCYTNPDLKMPPKEKLPQAEIATLTAWVKMGAPWPGSTAKVARIPGKITEEDRNWWAFRPVAKIVPPDIANIQNPIDRFVVAKLQSRQLTPAPEADRRILIRRVTFDLIGLPPTPGEVEAFIADQSPDAYEKVVDRLLASPHYGERSARLWLDLVRYADSDGYRLDEYRPDAWRYRDYVIRAYNADKPYDRFVQEQLAGDELFPNDHDARIATGYLRHGVYEFNQSDVRLQWNLILDDITDTTGDVFLGLGMQCARCHDHKFDPILQKDYFRLRAFFSSLKPRDDLTLATAPELAKHAQSLTIWEAKTASIRAELATIEAPYRQQIAEEHISRYPAEIQAMMHKPLAERLPLEQQLSELGYRQVLYEFGRLDNRLKPADKERVLALRRELATFDPIKPSPLPTAFAATDIGTAAPPTTIPKKGDAIIDPGFLTLLDDNPATIQPLPTSTGRRSALAKWLTNPNNPLTARVMVNRLWQQSFGKGLAANASDFGHLGEMPSNPELLDWLAAEFISPKHQAIGETVPKPWSVKHLHRLMVTSAAYRRSANHPDPEPGKLADPENRLLWRGNVRRLDAEQIRDALFSATGELDKTAGGPGVNSAEPRRSIYTRYLRNTRDPILDVFDAPFGFNSAASRDTTTTPIQSLLLINGQPLLRRGRALSDRLAIDEPDQLKRIQHAYHLLFGRAATSEELTDAQTFLAAQLKRVGPAPDPLAEFVAGKIPHHDGQAAELKFGKHPGFSIPHANDFPKADFTIEAFINPHSISDSGAVRTIAAKWDGNDKHPGWAIGITGKQSRRKPQTMVMQLYGKKLDGNFAEELLFSDHTLAMDKPYYIAVTIHLANGKEPGLATFYLKDLANDDEPLLIARVPHSLIGGIDNDTSIMIGSRGPATGFDGTLDDIRLSGAALNADQLLYASDRISSQTSGYWRFEAKPGILRDSSGHGHDIKPPIIREYRTPQQAVWDDLCHVLLNASEFLYVE